jgi:hypothetical protein
MSALLAYRRGGEATFSLPTYHNPEVCYVQVSETMMSFLQYPAKQTIQQHYFKGTSIENMKNFSIQFLTHFFQDELTIFIFNQQI